MEQQEFKGDTLNDCPHTRKRHLPVRWQHFDMFPVPVRHRCLKLPRSRFVRFLRQQVARG